MSTTRPSAVIVLAAGDGTRMKSDLNKMLHSIGGRPLVGHALLAAARTEAPHVAVTVRASRERVVPVVQQTWPEAVIADQDDIKGTGRAAECALDALPADLSGTVLVTYGDTPLLATETLLDLTRVHEDAGNAVTVLTAHLENPSGYGRIYRGDDGAVQAIVEHKDAIRAQQEGGEFADAVHITEINSGIYAFDAAVLRTSLTQVSTDNAQGEKYLTDVLAIARAGGGRVDSHSVEDVWQIEGVNDKVQLARMGRELNARTLERLMRQDGAIIIDPATTWVDVEVSVGRDTVVHPGCQLRGATTIGADCEIGPDSTLVDTEVGDGASVVRTHAVLAQVGPKAMVGPFSYLRAGTVLGAEGKIGGFVETKNAQIGDGAKVPHLSYVGDAEIGEGTNIGAGTIFANYDGVNKHKTVIGKHAKTGSNNTFVAPAVVGDGAGTGGGTVVRGEVPPGALGVSSGPLRIIEDWAQRKRPGTAQAQAAAAATTTPAPPTTRVEPVETTEGADPA